MDGNKRFIIKQGGMEYEVDEADTLEEALFLAERYDCELSEDDWDNGDNHWVLDTETGKIFEPDYDD